MVADDLYWTSSVTVTDFPFERTGMTTTHANRNKKATTASAEGSTRERRRGGVSQR